MRIGQMRTYVTPVTALALLLNLCVFVAVFWLTTISTLSSIQFIDAELAGLHEHHAVMQRFIASPEISTYEQMQSIGDASNLILDPELGSYYLMNLVIRLVPEMRLIAHEDAGANRHLLLDRQLVQARRSLQVAAKAGVDTTKLEAMLKEIAQQPDMATGLYHFYRQASAQLYERLQKRRSFENTHLIHVSLAVSALFVFSSVLLMIAITYYVRQKALRAAQEKLAVLEQLQKANAELEHFSYFTAHDLKEPVRTVACFTTLLAEALQLPEKSEAQRHLAIIQQAANRMANLIEAILLYVTSSSGVAQEKLQKINLTDEVRAVMNDLQQAIQETDAKIDYAALPVVMAPAVPLRRVLQNLLANAIRYNRPNVAPHIIIQAEEYADGWRISIRDNGRGFDQAFAKQAFEPFKRLHDEDGIKSSGIGLSICQKLVAGWGGEIGAESQVNQGATFFFTIPSSSR